MPFTCPLCKGLLSFLRGTVIVIFGSCDPSNGYSPCSPFTNCTVQAVDLTYNTWMDVT